MISVKEFDEIAKQAIRDLIDSNLRKGKCWFEVYSPLFNFEQVKRTLMHEVIKEYDELGWEVRYRPKRTHESFIYMNSGGLCNPDRITIIDKSCLKENNEEDKLKLMKELAGLK